MNDRELNDNELDQQIRSLVASAVAATPPPPEMPPLDELPATSSAPRRSERTGWIMAGAGIAAAAALVGVLVWTNDDDDRTIVAASTTIDAATTNAVTVPPTKESPTTVATTEPSTTLVTPPTVPPPAPQVAVSAGPDGVWRVTDGVAEQLVTEPMSMVLQLPDGSLIMQRESGWDAGREPSATSLLGWTAAGGIYELFPEEATDLWLRLYDVAVVDGELTLLYAEEPEQVNIESPSPQLMARSLDTGVVTVVATDFGGWESGYSRMHLAETGLIVGTAYSGPSHALASFAIGGATPIDGATLGIEGDYGDCSDCPRTFAVSRDGNTVAWLDGTRLMRRTLDGSIEYEWIDLGERSLGVKDLDLGNDLGNGFVILTYYDYPESRGPILFDTRWDEAIDVPGVNASAVVDPTPPWQTDDALTAALAGQHYAQGDDLFAAVEEQIEAIKYAAVDPVEPIVFRRSQIVDYLQPTYVHTIIAPNFDDSVPESWYRIVLESVDDRTVEIVRIETVDVCRNFTFSTPTHLCV